MVGCQASAYRGLGLALQRSKQLLIETCTVVPSLYFILSASVNVILGLGSGSLGVKGLINNE